uniref:Isoform 3 of Uncharacterized protein encoded by LINC01619 n=1 Tax=Homo sapiens TaxID=9606 RepID=G3V211-3
MNVCCSSHPVNEKVWKPSSRKWSSKVWSMDEFDLQTACYWFMTRSTNCILRAQISREQCNLSQKDDYVYALSCVCMCMYIRYFHA